MTAGSAGRCRGRPGTSGRRSSMVNADVRLAGRPPDGEDRRRSRSTGRPGADRDGAEAALSGRAAMPCGSARARPLARRVRDQPGRRRLDQRAADTHAGTAPGRGCRHDQAATVVSRRPAAITGGRSRRRAPVAPSGRRVTGPAVIGVGRWLPPGVVATAPSAGRRRPATGRRRPGDDEQADQRGEHGDAMITRSGTPSAADVVAGRGGVGGGAVQPAAPAVAGGRGGAARGGPARPRRRARTASSG